MNYRKNQISFCNHITLLEKITSESLKKFPQSKLFYYIYSDLIIPPFQVFYVPLMRDLLKVYEMTKINQFNNIFENFYCNFV